MRQRGFTLIELMVVVGVLVVTAALVMPLLGTTQEDASVHATQVSLKTIRDAIVGTQTTPGYANDMRYVSGLIPTDKMPLKLRDLIERPNRDGNVDPDPIGHPGDLVPTFDPSTRKGWRGPYLDANGTYPDTTDNPTDPNDAFSRGFTTVYGTKDDPALIDAWLRPIVIQRPDHDTQDGTLTAEEETQFTRVVSAGPNGIIDTPRDKYPLPSDRKDDVILFINRADIQP